MASVPFEGSDGGTGGAGPRVLGQDSSEKQKAHMLTRYSLDPGSQQGPVKIVQWQVALAAFRP